MNLIFRVVDGSSGCPVADAEIRVAPYIDVPPHLLPRGGSDAVLPGTQANVWKTRPDADIRQAEHPELASRREMLRIYRQAERVG